MKLQILQNSQENNDVAAHDDNNKTVEEQTTTSGGRTDAWDQNSEDQTDCSTASGMEKSVSSFEFYS